MLWEAARQRAARNGLVSARARSRIERVAAALDDQPVSQGLTTYYPNLHRDWCWDDEENRASLEAVAGMLPGAIASLRGFLARAFRHPGRRPQF